jgi:hypothetical protein
MNEPRKMALVLLIIMAFGIVALIFEWLSEVIGRMWLWLIAVSFALLILALTIHYSHAHDLGQWENSDPIIREWYRTLMRPDAPESPCCGVADAYWADEVHVRDGKTYATITDDRDDAPLQRPHIPAGTVVEVPDIKLKWDRGNPTGHNIIFLSPAKFVWCFVQGTGI